MEQKILDSNFRDSRIEQTVTGTYRHIIEKQRIKCDFFKKEDFLKEEQLIVIQIYGND